MKIAILESTFIQNFKKGTILLQEGNVSKDCYFIIKGCVRSYFLEDGQDRTIEFYTEEQCIVPTSYGTAMPSNHYLECMEDTVVSVGNPKLEKETFQKYPQLENLARVIAETIIVKQQDSFTHFKTSTPTERYLNLIKTRPGLCQRVPQHQIASYLGITPESLSRIKKE
nr:Crp/Fnr family transcriptional regulator [Arenibacter sp. S6351L]